MKFEFDALQILLGVRDCHEDLASQSLHCLADLVKVLGRDTVIGGKSKAYFTQGSPKVFNTICTLKHLR